MSIEKQWLTIDYDSYTLDFNKPVIQFEFGNTFSLGKGYTISADYTYTSPGHWRDFSVITHAHSLDIALRKSFLNDALSVELRGHDLLLAK